MPFSTRGDRQICTAPAVGWRILPVLLFSLLLFAACSQPGGYYSEYGAPPIGESYAPTHYYPPPGPPEDPWGPYIREAADRYGVPGRWVRAVMKQESDGQEQATSPVGAMGLMQVMPATYQDLRARYGLGSDPYDPHNNILAGTAYIREMYDQFGSPGFLAGYNAGPDRVDAYLAGTASLPNETVNYLAAVTPNLGPAVPLSGPFATYASARPGVARRAYPAVASLAAGCNLNAAYDPNHPCTTLIQAATAPAATQQAFLPQTGVGGCDLNAAYDPGHPCTSAGQNSAVVAALAPQPSTAQGRVVVASAAPFAVPAAIPRTTGCDPTGAYDPDHPCPPSPSPAPGVQLASAENCEPNPAFDPDHPCRSEASAAHRAQPFAAAARPALSPGDAANYQPTSRPRYHPAGAVPPRASAQLLAIPERNWGVQVGAFASPALARAVAEAARAQAPGQLRAATLAMPPIASGGSVLYRARLVNLSQRAAANACTNLNRRQLPCVVVQPSRS
jgi:D-alanyl-D-alanine carboxypeptidase